MSFQQTDVLKQLATVNPDDLISYVDKKGWVEATPRQYNPTTKTFVLSEIYEIIVPITTQIPNYPILVANAINIMSKLENRGQSDILKEIIGMNRPLQTYKMSVEYSVSSDLDLETLEKVIANATNFGVEAVGQQYKAQTGKTTKIIPTTIVVNGK